MSTELKTVVESLLSGFVAARAEADKVSVSVAREYQDCDIRRNLPVPMVDIETVSVDLRFAFDENIEPSAEEINEKQNVATEQASQQFYTKIRKLRSVASSYKDSKQRSAFASKITNVVVHESNASLKLSAKQRELKMESAVESLIETDIVNLTKADFSRIKSALSEFQTSVDTVPADIPKKPSVLIGAKALSGLSEDVISSMRIDVKLKSGRWETFESETGEVTSEFVQDNGGSYGC